MFILATFFFWDHYPGLHLYLQCGTLNVKRGTCLYNVIGTCSGCKAQYYQHLLFTSKIFIIHAFSCRIFEAALQRASVTATEAIHIGDNYVRQ